MINFDYIRPSTQTAAIDALSKNSKAKFIAGGTNLIDLMKRGVTASEKIIDINRLPLKDIQQTSNGISIGALALNSKVAEHELVLREYPLLSLALKSGASPQIRNMATVGGNMMQRTRCSYFYDLAMPCNKRENGTGCGALHGYNRMHAIFGANEQCIAVHPSDMCIALAALDAMVIIAGTKRDRRIAFRDFHRLPGNEPQKDNNLQKDEMIIAIEIPKNNFKHTEYLKVRDRSSYAFALVSVAVALDIDGNTIKEARLAMGGVAHKPWRLLVAENFLAGRQANDANFKHAAQIAMSGAKGYGGNDFKLKMAPNVIIEALRNAAKV
jgi:xanthine dehydrogenase YagS FAD-binding subunit